MEKLTNLLKVPTSIWQQVKAPFSKVFNTLNSWINHLNLPQRLYVIALILMLFSERNWPIICLLVLVALGLEFWPRFTNIWHSLLGKSCLLFVYALVANFALATAASVVNDITGVAAEHLPYSHNFAILIYLPVWIVGFTFLALLVIQLLSPLYIIAILLLKPFGIQAVKILSQSSFPVLTTIVRMGLSAVILVQLMIYNEGDVTELSNKVNSTIAPVIAAADGKVIEQPSNNVSRDVKGEEFKAAVDNQFFEVTIRQEGDNVQTIIDQYHHYALLALNHFIFNLEADVQSRCQVVPPGRVVELNDYEMLEITQESSQPYGFSYAVKPCGSIGVSANKS